MMGKFTLFEETSVFALRLGLQLGDINWLCRPDPAGESSRDATWDVIQNDSVCDICTTLLIHTIHTNGSGCR